jgi:hypothetical protein
MTNWTCTGPRKDKANSWDQAGTMGLESATVDRPHTVIVHEVVFPTGRTVLGL